MTVIRPNSISGINSITAQGGDINVYRADGTKSDIFINNITGVAATFTGNLGVGGVLTYEDVANIDSVGVVTARTDINLGDSIIHIGDTNTAIRFPAADTVSVETGGSERARFDSNGRLLVGTDTARAVGGNTSKKLEIESTDASSALSITRNSANDSPAILSFGKSRSASNGGTTVVQDGDLIGQIQFAGADGTDLVTQAATITGRVDGTPGSNDMPGRLVLSTTADGAASPTERLRITKDGAIGIAGANYGTSGQFLQSQGSSSAVQWASPAAWVYGTAADYDQWGSLTDVQFDGWPSTWQEIRVSFINISLDSGQKIQFFVSKSSSTAARITSGYQNTSGYYGSGTGVASVQNQGQFHGTESYAYQMNGYVSFYKFSSTVIRYEGQLVNKTDTYVFHTNGFVTCDPTTSMTHIFFRGTGASYDYGQFKLDYLAS